MLHLALEEHLKNKTKENKIRLVFQVMNQYHPSAERSSATCNYLDQIVDY